MLLDMLLARLRSLVPREYRELWKFLEALEEEGATVERRGAANLVTVPYDAELGRYCYLFRRAGSDAHVATQVLRHKEYLPLAQLAERWAGRRPIRQIVDAGANVGYATIFLKRRFPAAACLCLEPDPANFALLEENIRANDFTGVQTVRAALWIKDEPLALHRDFRDGADWSIRVKPAAGETGPLVRAMTLEQIPEIDILKVDIEGAEALVFSSAGNAERFLPKVAFLALEIHDETGCREPVLQFLREHGFEMEQAGETWIGANRRLLGEP